MKKLLTLALSLALVSPAFAQKMGGSNRSAPTVKQSVEAGAAKMSLDYTAITWADGNMMKMLADKENGAGARKMVNDSAPKSPLASFSSSVDVKCGELHIPAGDYKVFFTIDDDCHWHLNFQKGEDKALSMKLELAASEHESGRLLMCLYAEDKGAGVYLSFGSHTGMLTFAPVKPAEHR
ncbi:MAG: hypothetical protein H6835_10225 [Planctomycetes bacterium]|nr:hypothetical protein [Planctomycetota bacterium]